MFLNNLKDNKRYSWYSLSLIFISTIIVQITSHSAKPRCRFLDMTTLQCTGTSTEIFLYYPPFTLNRIQSLELIDHNSTLLNVTTIDETFPNLTNLTISKGVLSSIIGNASNKTKLTVLKLNNLPIKHIKERTLGSLRRLRILDLRNNSFVYLHRHKLIKLANLTDIYLSGNPWNCTHNLSWIFAAEHLNTVKDLYQLKCRGDPFDNKPILYIAEVKHRIKSTCPNLCLCTLTTVTLNRETNMLRPAVEVNCSRQNLTNFPEKLPEFTTKLIMKNNSVEDLSPLIKNPIYSNVTDLFLDYNKITNVELLEGTHWLSNFRILSLKGNLLSEIPIYALSNALRQNPNMPSAVMMYFSENPWQCNCIFTPSFQDRILVRYAPHIQDLSQIRCAYVKGDENSLLPIVQLSKAKICHTPPAYSEKALNLLNGVLAFLIVLVLGKLGYDYYIFKKSGKLPWIATKMP